MEGLSSCISPSQLAFVLFAIFANYVSMRWLMLDGTVEDVGDIEEESVESKDDGCW